MGPPGGHVGAGRPGRPSFVGCRGRCPTAPTGPIVCRSRRQRATRSSSSPGITLIVACAIVDTGRVNHCSLMQVAYTARNSITKLHRSGPCSGSVRDTRRRRHRRTCLVATQSQASLRPGRGRRACDSRTMTSRSSPRPRRGGGTGAAARAVFFSRSSPPVRHSRSSSARTTASSAPWRRCWPRPPIAKSRPGRRARPTPGVQRGIAAFTGAGNRIYGPRRPRRRAGGRSLMAHDKLGFAAARPLRGRRPHRRGAPPTPCWSDARSARRGPVLGKINHSTWPSMTTRPSPRSNGESSGGWECRMYSDLPLTTRRLLCVVSLWAERRHISLRRSDQHRPAWASHLEGEIP